MTRRPIDYEAPCGATRPGCELVAGLDIDCGLDLGAEELDEPAARIRSALAETGKEPCGA